MSEGLASHQSHKRMRRSLVGGETSELQCENLKTSNIGRKQSGDERSLIRLQTDISEENVFSQPHSVLANDSKRETGVVPADKERSMELKEEIDVEDTPIWERDDENRKSNIFSSATAGEGNRKELTSVLGTLCGSYDSASSSLILENKSESFLPSFSSVTASIHSLSNTASSSPFVSYIPTEERNDAMEDSSSCGQGQCRDSQSVYFKIEPVVKTGVISAVVSVHSECTVGPMHKVWVEEMQSWNGEEVMIGTDTALICSQEMANEDHDVAASDLNHPAVNPKLTNITSTSSSIEAEGERKEVDAQDVKVEKPEVNEHCMEQECKTIENNDSIVEKMVDSTQHGVLEMGETKVEKEDPVMVETIKGTEMDSAVEQNEAQEEEDIAPLSERVCKMLGKESLTSSRRPVVCYTVSDVQVHVKKQQRKKHPIECEICKTTFLSKSKLTSHMRTHTGERPFECDVCQKSFKEKGHLSVHKVTHTGERPFQCNVCKVSYRQKSNLIAHKWTHTGERPFQCAVCERSFSQKRLLLYT